MKKAILILNAITALDRARVLLRVGNGSIVEQVQAGNLCSDASAELRVALERECPEIKIEEST